MTLLLGNLFSTFVPFVFILAGLLAAGYRFFRHWHAHESGTVDVDVDVDPEIRVRVTGKIS
jgi:hypothetical protein